MNQSYDQFKKALSKVCHCPATFYVAEEGCEGCPLYLELLEERKKMQLKFLEEQLKEILKEIEDENL